MATHKMTVISLVGRSRAGKSTLAKRLARYLRTAHIETSDIVKTVDDVKDIPGEIAKNIERRLEGKGRSVIILSGIREIEIVHHLKENYNYYGFEVRAEMPVRFERALNDLKYVSAAEFIEGEIKELDLGLQEVEDDAPYVIPTSPFTDPDRITKATVKLLRRKNVALR